MEGEKACGRWVRFCLTSSSSIADVSWCLWCSWDYCWFKHNEVTLKVKQRHSVMNCPLSKATQALTNTQSGTHCHFISVQHPVTVMWTSLHIYTEISLTFYHDLEECCVVSCCCCFTKIKGIFLLKMLGMTLLKGLMVVISASSIYWSKLLYIRKISFVPIWNFPMTRHIKGFFCLNKSSV